MGLRRQDRFCFKDLSGASRLPAGPAGNEFSFGPGGGACGWRSIPIRNRAADGRFRAQCEPRAELQSHRVHPASNALWTESRVAQP
jgi:hypothetical protein